MTGLVKYGKMKSVLRAFKLNKINIIILKQIVQFLFQMIFLFVLQSGPAPGIFRLCGEGASSHSLPTLKEPQRHLFNGALRKWSEIGLSLSLIIIIIIIIIYPNVGYRPLSTKIGNFATPF